ncbi:MAG: hypothetical protein ACJA11_001503 [Glaciecola sp.]
MPATERYNPIVQLNPHFLDKVDFISVNLSGRSLTDESVLEFIISKFSRIKLMVRTFV